MVSFVSANPVAQLYGAFWGQQKNISSFGAPALEETHHSSVVEEIGMFSKQVYSW